MADGNSRPGHTIPPHSNGVHPKGQTAILRHAGQSETCGTFTPEDQGAPVMLVGSLAGIDRLTKLAQRHGIEPRTLIDYARKGA